MCGIAAIIGSGCRREKLEAMIACQHHRGPDAEGTYLDLPSGVGLGHVRLSIIDLSAAGQQPMVDRQGRYRLVFNGEIYNYVELRKQLSDYDYRSQTDTEVILAAYERWGPACLDHFIGMFSFAIWDTKHQRLFAARDRFGVKPLYYGTQPDGTLLLASEIKALHAAGFPARPDETAWATYLGGGLYDHSERTFWEGIQSLPPGHTLTWQNGRIHVARWYDVAERVGDELDQRPVSTVQDEYLALMIDSVRLRFRADVPVGINLSGGLDSSVLLGLVQQLQGSESDVRAYTFVTGDARYDELPWVDQMLARTRHASIVCQLAADDVPDLALSVQASQDEPFGGLPTLAYARVFERARADGVLVLLDGQGMDEQWAGYDYYSAAAKTGGVSVAKTSTVQGTRQRATRPECLNPEFLGRSEPFEPRQPFTDSLRNLQYRDTRYTKIPRALRFNDRISMRASVELREPFLDHRLFELALRQPAERKIADGVGKWLLRQIAQQSLPRQIAAAPKRPLQTPQREWLLGELRPWVEDCIDEALANAGDWFDDDAVRREWVEYQQGGCDSSFHVWQWISVGLCRRIARDRQMLVSSHHE